MVQGTFHTALAGLDPRKPYRGYKDEFAYSLQRGLTLAQHIHRHEELFRLLRNQGNIQPELPFTHAVAHTLLGLAMCLAPATDGIRQKRSTPFYQANMQGEMIVLPIQKLVLEKILANPDTVKLDSEYDLLAVCDEHYENDNGRLAYIGLNGAKACYYIGSRMGKSMFDIGMAYNFHNGAVQAAADEIAQVFSESFKQAASHELEHPHDWEEKFWWRSKVPVGVPYMADGQAQMVTPIINPKDDPDTLTLLKTMLPALQWIKRLRPYTDLLEDIRVSDLYDTMHTARLEPVLSHFLPKMA
ncbi:MAG: hypothetical protein KGQ41_00085 [Alphaproteobacteria bacterium]|nr:hypothetical protein [Alphaproteobacteria bacterium]